MSLRINDTVPNFEANTDQGPINFHDWIGDGWAIMFSHPKDFTPVCTTEMGMVAKLANEWTKRNTKVIGVSVDSAQDHAGWKPDIAKYANTNVDFPIIADENMVVSKAYNMLPADAYLPDGRTAAHSATVRTVYIIGPDKKLKLSMTYPMNVGRNFDEIMRALDALQLTVRAGVATPANWNDGDDVVVPPGLSNEDAAAKFGDFVTHFPYLRTTSQPA